jgi:NAD+ kinase
MRAFKQVAIIARSDQAEIAKTIHLLVEFLEQRKYPFILERETALFAKRSSANTIEKTELENHCDLAIVVGGDGSLLHAAQLLAPQNLPVLGINRGRLGFLTDIHPDELSLITPILEGNFSQEKRSMLELVIDENNPPPHGQALNDIVLFSKNRTHMIEFEIFIADQLLCHQRADGLIVATPTGSTAYALSAGGPILHPALNAFIIVPICAHTLTSRPIVIPDNSNIYLKLNKNHATTLCLSCDGQTPLPITHESKIKIIKNPHCLTLIHPKEYDYYATLRKKLHWGHTLTS